jgi:GMP synthase-like glutamine amidotransferase
VRVLFVKQDHSSPDGLIGDAFATAGCDVSEMIVVPQERYHSPDVRVTFPSAAEYDAVVLFGAIWSVYDTTTIPWVSAEIAYARSLLSLGVPALIDGGPWLSWHLDRFFLPPQVPVVARTALANQAFVYGRALGLQFHPEVTDSVLEAWLGSGGDPQLAELGVDPQVLIEQSRTLADGAAARAHGLVRRFLCDVARRPVADDELAAALAADNGLR